MGRLNKLVSDTRGGEWRVRKRIVVTKSPVRNRKLLSQSKCHEKTSWTYPRIGPSYPNLHRRAFFGLQNISAGKTESIIRIGWRF